MFGTVLVKEQREFATLGALVTRYPRVRFFTSLQKQAVLG